MEGLGGFIKSFLDFISEALGDFVIWWSNFVDFIPASELPLYVYIIASIIVLLLWLLVVRVLPRPLGGMSWIMLFAMLMTPGSSLNDSGNLAPAIIGVVHSILLKEWSTALVALVPILFVIVLGFFLGFIWQTMLTNMKANTIEKGDA